jgi:mono/diheme cytochrome c family protein
LSPSRGRLESRIERKTHGVSREKALSWIGAALLAALTGLTQTGLAAEAVQSPQLPHFADADDSALVLEGRKIYGNSCSSCHGRRLPGQALWQLQDQFAGRRAPAHDSTGHTWQHADEDLFHMTKFGRFPAMPADAVSYMPAFESQLSDRDILAALAFIKSNWPLGIRATQAMLNPGFAGMPADAGKVPWTLPPNCIETIDEWSKRSK